MKGFRVPALDLSHKAEGSMQFLNVRSQKLGHAFIKVHFAQRGLNTRDIIFRYRHPRIFTHLQNEDLRNGAQPLKNLGYEERALTKSERDQGS